MTTTTASRRTQARRQPPMPPLNPTRHRVELDQPLRTGFLAGAGWALGLTAASIAVGAAVIVLYLAGVVFLAFLAAL